MKIVLTKSQKRKALALIDRVAVRHRVAMNAQKRWMQMSGTRTGLNELQRSDAADCDVYDLLTDLRDIIDPESFYKEAGK